MNSNKNLDEYSKYIIENVKYTIEKCGNKDSGSHGEYKALNLMKEELKKYTDEIHLEGFKVAPKAFMGTLPVVGILLVISIITYFFYPLIALALSVISGALVIFEVLLYKKVLDPFFPKRISHNLIGIRNPANGSAKKRILIGGHADSAYEMRYNKQKKPRKLTFILLIPAVFGLITKIIIDLLNVIFNFNWLNGYQSIWGLFGLLEFVLLPFALIIMFFSDFSVISPGANDNLSGSWMAVALAKYMQDEGIKFENTEIRYINTGSEEAGLRGAKAYTKKHAKELKEIESIYIALDTFRDLEDMAIYAKDLWGTVKNHPGVSLLLKNAAKRSGLDLEFGSVFVGASDAAAFTQAGIPASCLAAMDPTPPQYYHTRYDKWEIMNQECIKFGMNVALEAMMLFDKEGLPS